MEAKNAKKVSIIVPTINEEGNIQKLVKRIDNALKKGGIEYEIILIDDHSTDNTVKVANNLTDEYPISCYLKKGKKGKAFSILEGFEYAKYDTLAMIDADLQYPPEAIPEMVRKIGEGAGVVVANRHCKGVNFLRKSASKGFNFVFGRILHGLKCDVQSGLKVFKKQITKEITVNPSQWTFDLEFLINARYAGYEIDTVNIDFEKRHSGQSKINVIKASWEIGTNALANKLKKKKPIQIPPQDDSSMMGAGLARNGRRFITHSTLGNEISALITFTASQKLLIFLTIVSAIAGFLFFPLYTAITLIAVLSSIYFFDVLFNLFLITKSLHNPPELSFTDEELSRIDESSLPTYSILCPLYRESAVLPKFLNSISKLDWPKDKLDMQLLLEENDQETINVANSMDLPNYVRAVIVPHSLPKTKPKACNYGLNLAKGEYLVVYDAEDMPEPQQLKKAYLAFQRVPQKVKCLQAKLNYYNTNQNLLTRLFTAEYSLWFEIILPGLQSINTSIPLGGTSNHFKTADLKDLKGWDPFNVTEDADLGARLFKAGFNTAIIDSTTLEEANSQIWNWIRQRSRWIKGYMQTYMVHTRKPMEFLKKSGIHTFLFQLNIGGKIAFMLINPILWAATISYFVLRSIVGPTIESIYPTPVFYIAVFSLVFGNFLYFYYYMIGCAKRGHWPVIKYVFLIPFYWFFMSIAAVMATYQLFIKPHFWEKTKHGLHLKKITKSQPVLEVVKPQPVLRSELDINFIREDSWLKKATNKFLPSSLTKNAIPGATLMIMAMIFGNFLNFLFNAFLGRVLSFEELGLVILVNTLWSVVAIFMGALSSTVNHKTAHLAVEKSEGSAAIFLKSTLKKGVFIALGASLIWIVLAPFLSDFFNISSSLVLLMFTPVLTLGVIASANRGFLNGNLHFTSVALIFFFESVSKFVAAALFVWYGLDSLVYLSIPISIAVASMASVLAVSRHLEDFTERIEVHKFPGRFFYASMLTLMSATIFLSIDIILVKHFLSPRLAGEYALISLVGKMIFFLGSLPNIFTITLISRDEGLKRSTKKTFRLLVGSTAVLSAVGFILLGPFGNLTVPILFGAKTLAILPYLSIYTFAFAIFTVSNSLVLYRLAKKQFIFPIISMAASLFMAVGIILNHGSVGEIVNVIFWASIFGFGLISLFHILEGKLKFAWRGVIDLKDAFVSVDTKTAAAKVGKRILIFNWRDTKHVFAGGAELYVHEIAKQWVKDGHQVTVFCGNDGKSKRSEVIGDVQVIRRGGFYFVYFWAFIYYITQFRGKYDIIVDCHNGIPFFTPIYSRKPIYCLIHHIHQEVFRHSLPKPLAKLAIFLERDLMPLVYRNVGFITVSESSKKDIHNLGLGIKKGIEVVNPGVNLKNLTLGIKSPEPTILYLGRLKAYKSVDVLIRAFEKIAREVDDAQLIIVGSGEEENSLKRLTSELNLNGKVVFKGRVSEKEKIGLLQKAWVFVNPSFMEGWGITTIEASACGTPIVASDVPGLRDSVKDMETGCLVSYGNSDAFAESILTIIKDKHLRDRMGKEAVMWASNFDWNKTSNAFLSIINK